jgi:hypothetical protein
VVQLRIESDGVLPGGLLLLYILPLQIRAAFIAALALSREANYADSKWSWRTAEHILLDLETEATDTLDSFVFAWVQKFEMRFRHSVLARVKLLEQELAMPPRG